MKKHMITMALLCLILPFLSAQEDWLDCIDKPNTQLCQFETLGLYDLPLCVQEDKDAEVEVLYPFKSTVVHEAINFKLPNPLPENVGEILMHFDDGEDYQHLSPGSTHSVTYSPGTSKTIIWSYELSNGDVIEGEFSITIKSATSVYTSPDFIWEITTNK